MRSHAAKTIGRSSADRESKSISEERTYVDDLTDPKEIDRELLARAEGVARSLRREGLAGRTVHLKVRTGDFKTATRALTLRDPADLAEPILDAVRTMYRERIDLHGKGVRLLGVGMSGLAPARGASSGLFVDADVERSRKRAQAADAVNDKLGENVLTRGSLIRRLDGHG